MKNFKSLKECLQYRINESEENYYYVTLWEEEVKQACSDIERTIEYIKNTATDEELWWLGEVMEEIVQKSQSKDLVSALTERSQKVADEQKRVEIQEDIENAARLLG